MLILVIIVYPAGLFLAKIIVESIPTIVQFKQVRIDGDVHGRRATHFGAHVALEGNSKRDEAASAEVILWLRR